VGLQHTGKKKVRKFSLGMKQRLSIAMALLNNPVLLILDEPTNGLDPNGIHEMRELLKKLNTENKITILVSSHLLSEIEKLVTHVGIIHQGKMLFQGTLEELMNKQHQSSSLVLETNDNIRASSLLADKTGAGSHTNGKLHLPLMDKEQVAAVNKQLVQAGISVYSISIVRNDLESIFMDITNSKV
jgi:lantibiotic transport system ATP-binding protein